MESKFTKADFKGFRFEKIILNDKKRVLDLYPHLRKCPEFDEFNYKIGRLSFDKILRYVLIMYSDTVVNQTIPELAKRKKECALLAGFSPNEETEKFISELEEIFLCNNKEVNKLIVRVLKFNRNMEYEMLVAFEESRTRQIADMVSGSGEKTNEKTKDQMDNLLKITKIIEDVRNSLLNKDDSFNLLDELYSEVDSDSLGIMPEEVAKSKKDGKLDKVLPAPYK